jgi:glycosyltransferase involved in cell wall biosynthesis
MNTLLIFKKNGFKDYDVVLATSPEILPCLAIRKIAKKNKYFFVFDVRDIWPDVAFEMRSFTEKSPQSIIFNHVANALYKSASLITTVSSEKISKLKDKRACINKDIVLIENGFDERMLELESDEDTIKKMNLKDKNIVCFIGNVGFAQGLKKYIDLAKEYSLNESLRFLVVGKGSDKANVISYAHRVGADNVEFFDPISQRGIATLLRHAKISYVSLVSDSMIDSIPTKLYESLGFGCPTLLVACGSSRSLIDATQHGLYARPSSFSEIKETFGRLLKLLPSLESKKSYIAEYILNNYSRNRNSERFADILIQKLNV